MEVTKEIYEKVVEICEEDYDLAHDVVMKLYDCEEICHPITTVIKILKKRILEKRMKEPNLIYLELDEDKFVDLIQDIHTNNEFAEFELKNLREVLLEILNSVGYYNGWRDRAVVFERFFEDKSYNEIGKEYGITGSRVQQIVGQQLRRMRALAKSQRVKDFFI